MEQEGIEQGMRPCPFCGCEARIRRLLVPFGNKPFRVYFPYAEHRYGCYMSMLRHDEKSGYDTMEAARNAWNNTMEGLQK